MDKETSELSVAIAKRYFNSTYTTVDCVERLDGLWDMIAKVEDPTLTPEQLNDLTARKLPIPTRWLTIAVVKPYIIEGIMKSLEKGKQNAQ